jgi:hypothetical protein
VLKARLFTLKQTFEKQVKEMASAEGSKYHCNKCEYGKHRQPYTTVEANAN